MFNSTLVGDRESGKQYISVFVPGHGFKQADSDHPMFAAILEVVNDPADAPAEEILAMFDVASGVQKAVADANLSSRVAVENGALTLDGDVLSDALADHILKLLAEQSGNLTGWVRFLERIDANTNEHSRKMLFSWLESLGKNDGSMTIDTKTGYLVGYKGVQKNADGTFVSVHAGPAIVDGREHTSGQVPNAVGSIIEMRRDSVQHDPTVGCSRGLHVGTWAYASNWARGAVLEVHVDPADVVSVPTDCDAQKMRCSKYEVVGVRDAPYNTATLPVDGSDEGNEEFAKGYCKNCEDPADVEDGYCTYCHTDAYVV